MGIVSSRRKIHPAPSGARFVLEYHTDTNGRVHKRSRKTDADDATIDAEMAAYALTLSDVESTSEMYDKSGAIKEKESIRDAPTNTPQAEYDRKMLGQYMLQEDVHKFRAGLDFFRDVESRGGANATQRAAYLGITRETYDQIAKRFNDLTGSLTFIDDEKNQIWTELPPEFVI